MCVCVCAYARIGEILATLATQRAANSHEDITTTHVAICLQARQNNHNNNNNSDNQQTKQHVQINSNNCPQMRRQRYQQLQLSGDNAADNSLLWQQIIATKAHCMRCNSVKMYTRRYMCMCVYMTTIEHENAGKTQN